MTARRVHLRCKGTCDGYGPVYETAEGSVCSDCFPPGQIVPPPEETYDFHFVICPYCGHKHSDADEFFGGNEDAEIECYGCSRTFLATRSVSVSYHAQPPTEPRMKDLFDGPGPNESLGPDSLIARATLIRPKGSTDQPLIPPEHVERVCCPGQGEKTCRFLASRELPNYFCVKSDPELWAFVNARAAEGALGSKGDNCSGPPDYKP